MHVFVSGTISRNVGHHYGQVKVQRVVISADIVEPIHGFVTADSTLYTADSTLWTADGYISGASDSLDAVVEVVGAVLDADVFEAADASDQADAISSVSADAVEPANALDNLDAVTDVAAEAIEAADAFDELDAIAVPAGVVLADVAEAADAFDQIDAAVIAAEVPVDIGGGRYEPPLQRPFPVVGRGYGILPQLWGEAHGVVGTVAKGAAELVVHATAIGACGQTGNAAVVLKVMAIGKGVAGARGAGEGMITKFSGSATGHHDDDEATVIAFLLAA